MYPTILVPIDGSDPSTKGLILAQQLARLFKSEVVLLHVLDRRVLALADETYLKPDHTFFADELRAAGEQLLSAVKGTLAEGGIQVRTVLAQGVVVEEIVRTAERTKASVVCMGSTGVGDWGHRLLGSVARGVLHHAATPVLIVPRSVDSVKLQHRAGVDAALEHLLVPVDGSPQSSLALTHATQIAKAADLAHLHVTHVLDRIALDGARMGLRQPSAVEVVQQLRMRGQKDLDDAIAAAQAQGVKATAHLREGRVAQSIVELAEELRIDLLCIGTHGRTGLSRAVLGSVAEAVVGAAPCPVLVTRSPSAQ